MNLRNLDDMDDDDLLLPGEVARIFRVDAKTVARWTRLGLLPCKRTIGGHRRFRAADVRAALDTPPPLQR